MDLRRIREEYENCDLIEANLNPDPIKQFKLWYSEVEAAGYLEPNAMVLSTSDTEGSPNARNVLLKEVDEDGFIFFSNFMSTKASEMKQNNNVSLTFSWNQLRRQIRIRGISEKIPDLESDEYWKIRPRGSQIGALVSNQSNIIESREKLDLAFRAEETFWEGSTIPRPSHWGGYKVRPNFFEFWQGRPNRLHDRLCYKKEAKGWKIIRLAP